MTDSARKLVVGVLLSLLAGALIGQFYGEAILGLLAAALLVLAWQVRRLLSFDRAIRTNNFDRFRVSEGIWEQIFARFRFERDRGMRRKASYRRLLREIRKSTNAMPDGAVILDANNEIVACNRAAKGLAGLKRKKDRGQRIDNILRDPKVSALLNGDDYERTADIPSPIRDGHWLNCRVVPYGGEQKLMFLRDVTVQARLRKMRRDFAANASHELRTPLTVINGYLDAMAEADDLPVEWQKPVSQMRSQSLRMKLILNEMLELSRLESSGSATLEECVDVVQLLNDVRDDFERPAAAAEIKIDVESSALLLGQKVEIESVIVNLLSNALRYTPQSGKITLSWRPSSDAAELIVKDTGEGIDPDHIPRLTERFYRVHRGRSRGEGGIGLGLAIVKHVLQRHDAELKITSEPGSGSEFRCIFPPDRVVDSAPTALS